MFQSMAMRSKEVECSEPKPSASLHVALPSSLPISLPSSVSKLSEAEIKQYVWNQVKDDIFLNMTIGSKGDLSVPEVVSHHSNSQSSTAGHSSSGYDSDCDLKLQQANKTLELGKAKIAESQKKLEHFACIISHEIRTPLHCIIGLSNLLVSNPELPEQTKESLRMINKSGDHLVQVVNDVLDYSSYESGKLKFNRSKQSLAETLRHVSELISIQSQERNVPLRSYFDTSVPEYITTDHRRLQQILFNLLDNAIKFSDANSMVELHVKVIDNKLRFVVRDYGIGIPNDECEQIFEPFFHGSNSLCNTFGGPGLGLSIVAKLVDGLNGEVHVESRINEFTSFTVDLPFVDVCPSNMEAVSRRLSNTTVLYVFQDFCRDTAHHFEKLCKLYNVCQESFSSFQELEVRYKDFDRQRDYICVCFEGQFDLNVYAKLSSRVKTTLMTFGPKNAVPQAKCHVSCTNCILPVVLMNKLASLGTETAKEKPAMKLSVTDIYRDLRILVAEDNIVNQKLLRMMLRKLGIQNVDMADNGQLALDQEAKKKYDVVLLDMHMPCKNGLETCRELQERYPNGGPRIAFVTAYTDETFRKETFEAGADAFLPKPFTLKGIDQCLGKLLVSHKTHTPHPQSVL